MNTLMWTSSFTAAHLATLRKLGVAVVPPIAKRLACGDTGVGAMAEPAAIAEAAQALLAVQQASQGSNGLSRLQGKLRCWPRQAGWCVGRSAAVLGAALLAAGAVVLRRRT